MSRDQLRTAYSDDQPGHSEPVGLRFVFGQVVNRSGVHVGSVIRIHGSQRQTLGVLDVFARDGICLDPIDFQLCSLIFDCAHTCWLFAADITITDVCTALAALPGTNGLPYLLPIAGTEEGEPSPGTT